MKVLVVCQYYYPEPFRITDICEELVRLGHNVTVVTGTPNYPMGEIYPGYEDGQKTYEVLNGVKIHRCITVPRKTGVLNRLKNYFSYPMASKKYVKTFSDDFDVVFVNQLSPVMMAEAGIWYKKKHNKRLVLYCLDLWPESLCVGGIKKDSVIYNIFKLLSKRVYNNADEILISSHAFRDYLKDMFGIADKKIHYLPQYSEAQFFELKDKKQSEVLDLLFAGNIGTAQSIDTIIDAARILKDESVVFHILGDGSEIEYLKELAKDLPKVVFYGRRPLEEMPKYYEMADAMLVTLTADPIISATLPGKVQTYMAAGKPIIGAVNGETQAIISEAECGICGPAGNAEVLAENIRKFIKSNRELLGRNAKLYYEEHFAKKEFFNKLEHELINEKVHNL